MSAILKLIRPINCLMGIIGVFIGAMVGIGLDIFTSEYLFEILIGMAIAFFFMAASNMMNDYFDREIDKVNHPDRPIPSGRFQARDVIISAGLIYILLIFLGLLVNFFMFIIIIIALVLMISYEISLKGRGFIGNLTISFLVALLFIFGAAVVSKFDVVIFLSLLAFLATLNREIVKDIEDIEGDIDRVTLPKRIGIRNASILAGIFLITAIIISLIPAFSELFPFIEFNELSQNYIYLIIPADIIFLSAISISFNNPTMASQILKGGMIIALIAFVIGSINI